MATNVFSFLSPCSRPNYEVMLFSAFDMPFLFCFILFFFFFLTLFFSSLYMIYPFFTFFLSFSQAFILSCLNPYQYASSCIREVYIMRSYFFTVPLLITCSRIPPLVLDNTMSRNCETEPNLISSGSPSPLFLFHFFFLFLLYI